MTTASASDRPRELYDVAILGGGLAGLTLGLQLKRARPETSVVVAERRTWPAPEATFKVGESTLEIGAHYFARVVGLEDHIDEHQLPKMGVRFFFPGDKTDIARRGEYGPPFRPPLPTYQLDRGRFENELVARSEAAGVDVRGGCSVEAIALAHDTHRVTLARDGAQETIEARWIVDASGRASLLKRELGLAKTVDHANNAAWFRVAGKIDVEDWTQDADWHARMAEPGLRWLSTNHLMDKGYWVWIIPLGSGNTSIGIVADPSVHPYETIDTLEKMLGWIDSNEPQLASVLADRRDDIVDFLSVEHYAHGCRQMFSTDRWCLTGETGVFLDPLFSPGSDFIGVCNSLVTDLIVADLSGQPIRERVAFANDFFLRYFDAWLSQYQGAYPQFDDIALTVIRFSWYRAFYFPIPVRLFFDGKLGDIDFLRQVEDEMNRLFHLIHQITAMLRDWYALEPHTWQRAALIKPPEFAAMKGVVGDLIASRQRGPGLPEAEMKAKVAEMIRLLEAAAVVTFHHALHLLPDEEVDPGARINPHAVGLRPERWQEDGLFDDAGLTVAEASEIAVGLQEELARFRSVGEPVA